MRRSSSRAAVQTPSPTVDRSRVSTLSRLKRRRGTEEEQEKSGEIVNNTITVEKLSGDCRDVHRELQGCSQYVREYSRVDHCETHDC
jgi:hypothetical protein